MKNRLYGSEWVAKNLNSRLRSVFISRFSFWFLGAMCALSLFVEEPRRRAELAMYVLPKGLESAWSMMRNRGYVPFIPWGESVVRIHSRFVYHTLDYLMILPMHS